MKKILIVCLILVSIFCFVSCAGWEQTKKDVKSNLGGGLNREIKVINQITGETVWNYNGKSYIDDESSVGDVTIIYYDANGNSKKADFIGSMFGVSSIEL